MAFSIQLDETGKNPPVEVTDEYISRIRAEAESRGVHSKRGGWVYDKTGDKICHGWENYARIRVWNFGR